MENSKKNNAIALLVIVVALALIAGIVYGLIILNSNRKKTNEKNYEINKQNENNKEDTIQQNFDKIKEQLK